MDEPNSLRGNDKREVISSLKHPITIAPVSFRSSEGQGLTVPQVLDLEADS